MCFFFVKSSIVWVGVIHLDKIPKPYVLGSKLLLFLLLSHPLFGLVSFILTKFPSHMCLGSKLLLFPYNTRWSSTQFRRGWKSPWRIFRHFSGGMSRPPQHRKLRMTHQHTCSDLDDQDLQRLWPAGFSCLLPGKKETWTPWKQTFSKIVLKVVKQKIKAPCFFFSKVVLPRKTSECFLKINAWGTWGSDAFPIEIYYCI